MAVFEILTLICQKLRRHVTLTTPTREQFVTARLILLGATRAQNVTILSSAMPETKLQYLDNGAQPPTTLFDRNLVHTVNIFVFH